MGISKEEIIKKSLEDGCSIQEAHDQLKYEQLEKAINDMDLNEDLTEILQQLLIRTIW